jgi:hypothetical protein
MRLEAPLTIDLPPALLIALRAKRIRFVSRYLDNVQGISR